MVSDQLPFIESQSQRPTFSKPNTFLSGKIVLEEHAGVALFNATTTTPFVQGTGKLGYYQQPYVEDVARRLVSIEDRVEHMNNAGIAVSAVSLAMPGIEGIFDTSLAVEMAKKVNDEFYKLYRTGPNTHRFLTWGTVAMQDPYEAAKEAERCVKELGCCGILINGYSNIGDVNNIQYLDEPQCEPFWAKMAELNVPLYLHPRIPPPDQLRVFKGYEFLAGSPWGFGRETAEHALRLMLSGLFDRFPNLQIVLGHCGEGLPFSIARTDHRLRHFKEGVSGPHKHSLSYYFAKNFWITTAGVQKQNTLENTIKEVGIDRVIFSVDYPFEDMIETCQWFEGLEMDDVSRAKLAFLNAKKLLRLD
jgi:2,3-dihydroxybenzoate decarboxylase